MLKKAISYIENNGSSARDGCNSGSNVHPFPFPAGMLMHAGLDNTQPPVTVVLDILTPKIMLFGKFGLTFTYVLVFHVKE